MTFTQFTLAAAAAVTFSTAASASSITVADGGTLCESIGQSTYTAASVGGCDVFDADLSNTAPGEAVSFLGSGTVFGYVADRRGTGTTLWPDYAQITLAVESIIEFTLFNTDSAFDAVVSFDGVSQLVDATNNTASFLVAAGTSSFFIDTTLAPAVNHRARNGSDYTFTVTPVPLPAGMVLMLTGLGGLAVARRKTKA